MKALDRTVADWFTRIRTRQLTLPRFQRLEAWDHSGVADLLTTVLRELPAGATLILAVGDQEKFLSRTMIDAPTKGERVTEQLLDGQQRLTALWRSLNDKYEDRTYLVGFEEDPNHEGQKRPYAFGQSRWYRNGQRYPLWVDFPQGCWERQFIPVSVLHPDAELSSVRSWVKAAVPNGAEADRDELFDTVVDLQQRVRHYNLPYLALPVETPREVALEVFVKMNTSSVRLTMFDIIVALVEEAAGQSLHKLVDRVRERVPRADSYADLPNLVLDVAALRQNRTPNNAGYKGIDFKKMISEWDDLIDGIAGMVEFLEQERVFDKERLPTYPAIPVIASAWKYLPTRADALGNAFYVLRKYLWRAFLTSRYERTTANASLQDFRGIKSFLLGATDETAIPVFNEGLYTLPTAEELAYADWPARRTTLGRGLLALQIKCGGLDIADGAIAMATNITKREYHHLFPDSLLRDCGIEQRERFRAVNCALITWRTNRTISNKHPLDYLRERADNNALGEEDLRYRLRTHLIPYDELALGGTVGQDDVENCEWLKLAYQEFVQARSKLLQRAATLAYEGRPLDLKAIYDG